MPMTKVIIIQFGTKNILHLGQGEQREICGD
jgi:hypothetical protein